MTIAEDSLVTIDGSQPIWERFFSVYPLVVIGSREPDGSFDLAPKHLAMPMSWESHFGFVCTPRHGTYRNIKREGVFTVSYPKPSQIVLASLAASPRCDDGSKPSTAALATIPAREVDGVFVRDGYLYLECALDRIIDGFGQNSLITGRILKVHVQREALREAERDDNDIFRDAPLLAYLYPGRFAAIHESFSFPFPEGFKR